MQPEVKVSGLPNDTSLDDNHYLVLNDPTGPTTKRTTLGTLVAFFQSIANFVTTAMLTNASVTPSKLATGAAEASQANSGTTTSTSFTATLSGSPGTNPAVTVPIGANGLALVTIGVTGAASGTPAGQGWFVGFAVSGANTIAAQDLKSIGIVNIDVAANGQRLSGAFMLSGLTPGNTTFTMQYRASGATTLTVSNRTISVTPL